MKRVLSTFIACLIASSSAYAAPGQVAVSGESDRDRQALDNFGTELFDVVPFEEQFEDKPSIPAVTETTETVDPETGEPVKVSITVVQTSTPEEYAIGQSWLSRALGRAKDRGENPKLYSLTRDIDAPEDVIIPDPEQWQVPADRIQILSLPTLKWHQFSSWMHAKSQEFRDKIQYLRMDMRQEAKEQAALQERYETKFDQFLRGMDENKVRIVNPLPRLIGRPASVNYVRKTDATMALVRVFTTGTAFATGIAANGKLSAPIIADVSDGLALGTISGSIQIKSDAYLKWFENPKGPVPFFMTPVKWLGTLLGVPISFFSKFAGVDIKARDVGNFAHDLSIKSTRYALTEYPVLGVAAAVLLGFGVNMFAETPVWATKFFPTHEWLHVWHNIPLVMSAAVGKALGAQGTWDFGTAKMVQGLRALVDQMIIDHKITAEIAARMKRRITFKGSIRILAISMLSNFAVVFSMPKNAVAQYIGDHMILWMTIIGVTYMATSYFKYEPLFKKLSDRLSEGWNSLLGRAGRSCAEILQSAAPDQGALCSLNNCSLTNED